MTTEELDAALAEIEEEEKEFCLTYSYDEEGRLISIALPSWGN